MIFFRLYFDAKIIKNSICPMKLVFINFLINPLYFFFIIYFQLVINFIIIKGSSIYFWMYLYFSINLNSLCKSIQVIIISSILCYNNVMWESVFVFQYRPPIQIRIFLYTNWFWFFRPGVLIIYLINLFYYYFWIQFILIILLRLLKYNI